jgi:hypothetical protein
MEAYCTAARHYVLTRKTATPEAHRATARMRSTCPTHCTMGASHSLQLPWCVFLRPLLKLDLVHGQLAHVPCARLWCALGQCGWCDVALVRRCAGCDLVCTLPCFWPCAYETMSDIRCLQWESMRWAEWIAGCHAAWSGILNGMIIRVNHRQGLACGGYFWRLDDHPRCIYACDTQICWCMWALLTLSCAAVLRGCNAC